MYIRPVHAELEIPTLHQLIRANPLGLFTTAIPHPTHATIQTSHVPFVLDPSPDEKGNGVLRGHMARANPQVKAMIYALTESDRTSSTVKADQEEKRSYAETIPSSAMAPTSPSGSSSTPTSSTPSSSETQSDIELDPSPSSSASYLPTEILIIFQSPTHSYLTPQFYTTTKPLTGKVVPTWNYAAVQVYGKLRLYHQSDSTTSDFLSKQINDLTVQQERLAGREQGEAWHVSDAPENYTEMLKKGIVGMEVEIDRIEGRFKLSQESEQGDWEGVVKGLEGLGTDEGREMAGMVRCEGMKAGKKAEFVLESETQKPEFNEGKASWGGRLSSLIGMGKAA